MSRSIHAALLLSLLLLGAPGLCEGGKNVRIVAPPMREHDGSLQLRCPLCQRPFETQAELVHHVRFDHPALKCPECGMRCATPEALREHRLRHHRKGVFVCPECGTVFASEGLLRAHRENSHGDHPTRGWPCRICGRSFDDREALLRHRELAHPGTVPVPQKKNLALKKCPWCETRLPEGPLLDEHVRRKHPKRWARRVRCPICRRFFPSGEALEVHIKGAHGDLPGLHRRRCPRCKTLLLPDEWDEHMEKVHGIAPNPSSRK